MAALNGGAPAAGLAAGTHLKPEHHNPTPNERHSYGNPQPPRSDWPPRAQL
jgi:hypothetical protein